MKHEKKVLWYSAHPVSLPKIRFSVSDDTMTVGDRFENAARGAPIRLLRDERRLAGAGDLRRQLRLRAERLGQQNGRLKAEYDALMERQRRAERRLREEKLRGSRLLEDVVALKRQAAARLNQRNDRRCRCAPPPPLRPRFFTAALGIKGNASVVFVTQSSRRPPAEGAADRRHH